jgi:hypothetical protein
LLSGIKAIGTEKAEGQLTVAIRPFHALSRKARFCVMAMFVRRDKPA